MYLRDHRGYMEGEQVRGHCLSYRLLTDFLLHFLPPLLRVRFPLFVLRCPFLSISSLPSLRACVPHMALLSAQEAAPLLLALLSLRRPRLSRQFWLLEPSPTATASTSIASESLRGGRYVGLPCRSRRRFWRVIVYPPPPGPRLAITSRRRRTSRRAAACQSLYVCGNRVSLQSGPVQALSQALFKHFKAPVGGSFPSSFGEYMFKCHDVLVDLIAFHLQPCKVGVGLLCRSRIRERPLKVMDGVIISGFIVFVVCCLSWWVCARISVDLVVHFIRLVGHIIVHLRALTWDKPSATR